MIMLWLFIIILLCIISIKSCSSVSLYDALKNHNNLNIHQVHDIYVTLPVNTTAADIWPREATPFLHHLLNLYRLTPDPKIQTDLINFMVKCIDSRFADVNEADGDAPPLFIKAMIIKELKLATTIILSSNEVIEDYLSSAAYVDIEAGSITSARVDWLLRFFNMLYSVPSEPVPLAKLLLHADTVLRRSLIAQDTTRKMLSAATVSGQVSVKPADLDILSPTYLKLVQNLGSEYQMRLQLCDTILVLDEAGASVHNAFISVLLGADLTSISDASHIHLSLWRVMLIHQWFRLLVMSDKNTGRNMLHTIALSGAATMLRQITSLIDILYHWAISEDAAASTADAITNRLELLKGISNMLAQSLLQTDYREHTPISYALYRFRHVTNEVKDESKYTEAPIIDAINELSTRLGEVYQSQEIVEPMIDNILAQLHSSSTSTPAVSGTEGYESVDDDGDWPSTAFQSLNDIDLNRCDIEEVWGLNELPSNKEFFQHYINVGKPVIFRNVGALNKGNTTLPQLTTENRRNLSVLATQLAFQKDSFAREFGMYHVPSSSIPYAGSFGFSNEVKLLSEVIESIALASTMNDSSSAGIDGSIQNLNEPPMYTFCTPSSQWSDKLQRKVPIPRSISRTIGFNHEDSGVGEVNQDTKSWNFEVQFYLGPAGSGAPVHFHGHAINTMAFGEKYWTLYAPANAFYSTTAAAFRNSTQESAVGGKSGMLVCTQRSGDVIYVPSMWGHGTLNTRTSIGVAHEFSIESFCME